MARDIFVAVENGEGTLVGSSVRAKVAIQMIQSGAAVISGPLTIKLTFSDYIAAAAIPAKKERQPKESSYSGGVAISPLQNEMVYTGSMKDGASPTTTATVLRKARGNTLVNWSEKDRFRHNRFNPDRLPVPLFPSIRALESAR